MRNYIDEKEQDVAKLKDENQKLKDQINKLKGEKGKPNIKPPKEDKDNNDDSSNSGNGKKDKKSKNNRSGSKKDKIEVTRKIQAEIDKDQLPEDAEYKGVREIVIQDIKINLDNIKFVIPIYYSPSAGKNYEGEIFSF